MSTQVLVN